MSPTVINYVRSSVAWLAVGITLGILMALGVFNLESGAVRPYVTQLHAHVNLLGWVSMMIFGVAYHILPRFSGRPLHNDKLADIQLWLSNIGIAGMTVAMLVGAFTLGEDYILYAMAPFGALYGIGSYLFVYNIWKTVGAALPPPGSAR